ncbi:MAG: DUF3788 domain-containing protein [Anaerolineales bacterium]|nr:DUF3788 domain-containing protein [Anaerolineales bacterium]
MSFERLLNRQIQPDNDQILATLGLARADWLALRTYIETHYEIVPELKFFAKQYGWTLRYARKGKTLCYLFPETDAFSVLIVFGKKEVEKASLILQELCDSTRKIFTETPQLHDGRWLWIRVTRAVEAQDVIALLQCKQIPITKK